MTGRSYDAFQRPQATYLTGANILDVSKIGIDGALLSINASQLTDAFGRVHQEVTVKDNVQADGIRPDGTFGEPRADLLHSNRIHDMNEGQHIGILYNGNYGKFFAASWVILILQDRRERLVSPIYSCEMLALLMF